MAPVGDGGEPTAPAPVDPAVRRRRTWRILLLGALVVSWLVCVPFMWKSVTAVPSAARLQAMQSRIMHVPSPATFLRTAGQSFAELAALALLLWPWWRRLWSARLMLAFLSLALWAVITMPLELTQLEWVHHRWLVGCDLLLLAALIATLATRLVEAVGRVRKRKSG